MTRRLVRSKICSTFPWKKQIRFSERSQRQNQMFSVRKDRPENSAYIKIPIEAFDLKTISFTYGDSHPTFSDRVNDGKEYRKKVYTYEEIIDIIKKYDLPQEWNNDGNFGPERYVEAHIWSDETIRRYLDNEVNT